MAYTFQPVAPGPTSSLYVLSESKAAEEVALEFLQVPKGKTFVITDLQVNGFSATANTISVQNGTTDVFTGAYAIGTPLLLRTGVWFEFGSEATIKLKLGKLVEAKVSILVKGILR